MPWIILAAANLAFAFFNLSGVLFLGWGATSAAVGVSNLLVAVLAISRVRTA